MHIDNEIIAVALACLVFVAWIIIVSIKEKEDVLRNLSEFFKDWWFAIKSVCIVFVILLFIAYCISLGI